MRKTKTEWDECKFPFPREGQKCGWGFNDLNPNLERARPCISPTTHYYPKINRR